jgi:hypothetical protein
MAWVVAQGTVCAEHSGGPGLTPSTTDTQAETTLGKYQRWYKSLQLVTANSFIGGNILQFVV